jgi:hypothetical protein
VPFKQKMMLSRIRCRVQRTSGRGDKAMGFMVNSVAVVVKEGSMRLGGGW